MNRIIIIILLIFSINIFCFSVYTGFFYASEAEVEIWKLKLTGDTAGEFKMRLKRVKNEKGYYKITGSFSGPMEDRFFGSGEMTCKFKGRIENKIFEAKLNGFAEVIAGSVSLWGIIKGTVSADKGFGIYNMNHDYGSPKGEWTADRIEPSQ